MRSLSTKKKRGADDANTPSVHSLTPRWILKHSSDGHHDNDNNNVDDNHCPSKQLFVPTNKYGNDNATVAGAPLTNPTRTAMTIFLH